MQLSNKAFLIITCLIMFTLITFSSRSLAGTIEIAAINSASQKTVAAKLFHDYEKKHPQTKIKLTSLSDADFKAQLGNWLESSRAQYDLIFWQGGNRLFRYVEKGQIAPISDVISEQVIRDSYTAASLGAVTYDNQLYAIPTSYYQWGIFYRKSIFQKAGLTPPQSWGEFIQVGKALKAKGIAPLALGNSGKWPASAWFDYLDLRINGLEFHSELLHGDHSFLDPRVGAVFSHWKELIDNGFFIKHQDAVDWNEALPFIYHSYAAMVLIGNFVTGELSPYLMDDFAFMPFPRIDASVPLYEDAPLDVLMVPSNVAVTPELKDLISYMSSASFQSEYNQGLGLITPHVEAKMADDEFIRKGAKLLSEASGVAQFFDRDTKADFVAPALDVFAQFLKSGNADRAQRQLEDLRQQHLISGH